MSASVLVAATFVVYLLVVVAIGVVAYRLTNNNTDYFLGGRRLSPWVAALSAGASDTSGWLLIGLPGYAYAAGFEAGWIALGLCVGVALSWVLVAKRLRVYSYLLDDALTLPTYFQRRFADSAPWLRSVAALFVLLFFLFYVSSALIGGAKLFSAVFELPYNWAVIVGALAVISYTLFGGFLAVSWTDVLQGLLITLALVVVPVMVYLKLDDALSVLQVRNPELLTVFRNAEGQPLGGLAIVSLLGWGLAYFGQPHILARFKAVRHPSDMPTATAIAISWSVLVYSGAVLVGVLGVAYLSQPLADTETVFMVLVETLFHPLVAGVLLAAILAAIMSTADSQLLVSSSALAEDLCRLWMKSDPGPDQVVALGRWAVVGLATMAALIALDQDSKVLEVVAYAWAGLGAAFGPALLISLYWRRMNRQGAMAGILVGGLTVITWKNLEGGLFDLYELVPGFVLSFLAVLVVSRMTPMPGKAVTGPYERMLEALVRPELAVADVRHKLGETP